MTLTPRLDGAIRAPFLKGPGELRGASRPSAKITEIFLFVTRRGCPPIQSRTVHLSLSSLRSKTVDIDDSFRKSLRSFFRQIVPDAALDVPVLIFAREFLSVGTRVRMWGTVGITFHCYGGHGDDRTFGQPLFQIVIFRFAFSETLPPAVIVDQDRDVVGIGE